ncbi:MAG: FkbM family methyltransferase [Candidatus Thorarchaeota archaeon]
MKYKELNRNQIFNTIGRNATTIVEIGACDGTDTGAFLNNFKRCHVYSVEPKPKNIEKWNKKHKNNPRTTLFSGVISETDGVRDLYVSDEVYQGASSIREPTEKLLTRYKGLEFNEKIPVKSLTLKSFVAKYGIKNIDLLWIDAQGAEIDIINGGIDVFNSMTRCLFIEFGLVENYKGQILIDDMVKKLSGFNVIGTCQENLFMVNKNKK